MTYEELVNFLKEKAAKADVSMITDHLAYQFNIEGEAAGAFYIEVKEGKIYVEPYEYHDRDALFTCTAKTLLDIIEKRLDSMLAFTIGKLKVSGDLGKAARLKELFKKS